MSKKNIKTPDFKRQRTQQTFSPDYYSRFRCIGPECEDSCCVGWRVDLDRLTFDRYQTIDAAPLDSMIARFVQIEQDASKRNNRRYAYISLLPNGLCPFLQDDLLCRMHKEQGGASLSETCTAFPRHFNQFANNLEYGLDISCPEAAKLVLLPDEPLKMLPLTEDKPLSETDADLRKRGFMTHVTSKTDPKNNVFRHAFRKLILRILQFREVVLGARVMMLGELLERIQTTARNPRFRGCDELHPILRIYEAMLARPTEIEAKYARVAGQPLRKIHIATSFLIELQGMSRPRFGECLFACVSGLMGEQIAGATPDLVGRYREAYEQYYLPFIKEQGHLLENYVVNDVLINLFPFIRGSYTEQYRTMVFNLMLIQLILIGMAAHFRGLTERHVVQLIQSFTRMAAHNDTYLVKLQQSLGYTPETSVSQINWLLKEF